MTVFIGVPESPSGDRSGMAAGTIDPPPFTP